MPLEGCNLETTTKDKLKRKSKGLNYKSFYACNYYNNTAKLAMLDLFKTGF